MGSAEHSQVLACVRGQCADLSPTLASCHGFKRSVETLRQWILADALWAVKRAPSLQGKKRRLRFCPPSSPLTSVFSVRKLYSGFAQHSSLWA